jgi:ribosomal peptide maturation radical SAM protein 1
MPWERPLGPNLALGLLKAVLMEAGIPCDVLYGNLKVGCQIPFLDLLVLGETPLSSLLLAPLAFENITLDSVLDCMGGKSSYMNLRSPMWQSRDSLKTFINQCGAEMDGLIAGIPLDRYDIVGFVLAFEQSVASLALARRLKRIKPDLTIVFGGPSCNGEMGSAYLEAYTCVDYAVSGDGDRGIDTLVRAIRSGFGFEQVPGLSRRENGLIVVNPPRPTINLDDLPLPDYSDYFEQLKTSSLKIAIGNPVIPIETSRGCWWGQKHACTFCTVNGPGFPFRRKSQGRIMEEIMQLSKKYRLLRFITADSVLHPSYFKELIPRLAAERVGEVFDVLIKFEARSKLKKQQVRALADSGLRTVEVGIESFSDHILKLMNKGATGIQQVQTIKWCDEYQLALYYNIIVYNPGETVADYLSMIELLPFIMHLKPPERINTMALYRFSPYFNDPGRYGITNIRPAELQGKIYGLPLPLLAKLIYHFEYDHPDRRNQELNATITRFMEMVATWKTNYRPRMLCYRRGPGFVRIADRRGSSENPPTARMYTLTGRQADVFLFCDACHTYSDIREQFPDFEEGDLRLFLDQMVSRLLMWCDSNGRCISLPIHTSSPESDEPRAIL